MKLIGDANHVVILNDTLSLIVTNSTNEINATLSVPSNLAIEKYATFIAKPQYRYDSKCNCN